MKEGIGGIFTLQAVMVALIVIMCLLAFSVNYTKAFRAKNEILNILERNNGLTNNAACEIIDALNDNNYFLPPSYESVCTEKGYNFFHGKVGGSGRDVYFCLKKSEANTVGEQNQNTTGEMKGAYYSVITFVTLDVPLVNNVIPISAGFFQVSGETQLIYSTHGEYGLRLKVQECK